MESSDINPMEKLLKFPVPRDKPRTQRIQKEMPKEKTPAITNLTRWEENLKSLPKKI
jgi:hypothetical protein